MIQNMDIHTQFDKLPKDIINCPEKYVTTRYEITDEKYGDDSVSLQDIYLGKLAIINNDSKTILSCRYRWTNSASVYGDKDIEKFLQDVDNKKNAILILSPCPMNLEWIAKDGLMELLDSNLSTVLFSATGLTALKIIEWIRHIHDKTPPGYITVIV
jgi:hypothetical protein